MSHEMGVRESNEAHDGSHDRPTPPLDVTSATTSWRVERCRASVEPWGVGFPRIFVPGNPPMRLDHREGVGRPLSGTVVQHGTPLVGSTEPAC